MAPFLISIVDNILQNEHQYIGWVPCVSGQLCYSFVECLLGDDGQKFTYNHKVRPEIRSCPRHLIALKSSIDWKDRLDKSYDGNWDVFLVAQSNQSGKLVGDVFIYPTEKKQEMEDCHEAFHLLNTDTNENEHEESHQNLKEFLLKKLDIDEFYQISFEMNESGITYLSLNNLNNKLTETDEYVLCRQAFYFLKYSLHTHKHHTNTLDSLTTVHPINDEPKNLGKRLIFDLKQSLVDINRRPSYLKSEINYNFTGITSYMKSLLESCKKEGLIEDKYYQYELNVIDNIALSYQAGNSHGDNGRKARFDARGEARQILLLIFAIIAPWVIIAKAIGSEQESIISSHLIDIYSDFHKSIAFIMCIIGLHWLFYFVSNRGLSRILHSPLILVKLKNIVHSNYKAYVISFAFFSMGVGGIILALKNIFIG